MNDPSRECHSVFQIMEGLFCVFVSLRLSLSCFLVVNVTKILGFLTQGEEGLSSYMISTNPHSPHDKPFKSQRGLKERLFSYT
jgi:hypothetical protein